MLLSPTFWICCCSKGRHFCRASQHLRGVPLKGKVCSYEGEAKTVVETQLEARNVECLLMEAAGHEQSQPMRKAMGAETS